MDLLQVLCAPNEREPWILRRTGPERHTEPPSTGVQLSILPDLPVPHVPKGYATSHDGVPVPLRLAIHDPSAAMQITHTDNTARRPSSQPVSSIQTTPHIATVDVGWHRRSAIQALRLVNGTESSRIPQKEARLELTCSMSPARRSRVSPRLAAR